MAREKECTRIVRNDIPNKPDVKMAHEGLKFYSLLVDESDRGCVLAIGAYLEELVRNALFARCRELSEATEKDLDSLFKNWESQFANFASCVRLAFSIGLIDRGMEKSLREFAEMRNVFAHRSGPKKITASQVIKIIDHYGRKHFSAYLSRIADTTMGKARHELDPLTRHTDARAFLMQWATNVHLSFMRGIERMSRP